MDLGVEGMRRLNGHGNPAPHLSLKFDSHLFSIDTSRAPQRCTQPEAYLITHAHSDHYGKSAMLSERAIASSQTARALEIRYGKTYRGRTFEVGESIDVNGVEIKTYANGHTIGSSAFFWESDAGTKVLVTGDIKDYRAFPKCDLLVTEANYGDPWDPSCIFDDDLAGFSEALESGAAFGAYAFGKAQRAVALIRALGYDGVIGMDDQSLALTEALMADKGPYSGIGRDRINVVTPWSLPKVPGRNKYFLTGRTDGSYPKIRLSDHLDFRGLVKMIDHTGPEEVLVYHPGGERSNLLALHLQQCGFKATALDGIESMIK